MKYKWYFCDAVKGIEDSYSEAKAELNKHLDFDIETEGEYKSESSGAWFHGTSLGYLMTTYFYPYSMDDVTIQNDDGAYTPQVKEVE